MTPYPHLLSPTQLGTLELPNRVIMGSMHTGLEDNWWNHTKLAAYYAERAAGGVGLIITGGYSPNWRGWLKPFAADLSSAWQLHLHRRITDAVHAADGKIALQLLHAGRYAFTPWSASASAIKAPINPFHPARMSAREVKATINDFGRSARLAQRAGYDAVEVMGSEGYLINQFLCAATNQRTDAWGGSASARMRFPIEIVRRIREQVGDDFPIIYRISLLDFVPEGQTWDEVVELAEGVVAAGADALSTGIGWHESRIPTILSQVPRAAWAWATARLKTAVEVPVVASNRINDPAVAEQLLAEGAADLVSMARPLLADPEFVNKAAADRADEIAVCIACNQACLDHVFTNKTATCLINPRAGRETTLNLAPVTRPAQVAVVGGGPAGLAAAMSLAERGDQVTLFEQAGELGGQFRYARIIPGKEEYGGAIDYWARRLEVLEVDIRLNHAPLADELLGFDEVVIATGVTPRIPTIDGITHPAVVTYDQLLSGEVAPGDNVAIIGAGGIGVDVAIWLAHAKGETPEQWAAHWGVGDPVDWPGALAEPIPRQPLRQVTLIQRKISRIGKGLGKTSGWSHRAMLRQLGIIHITGATYHHIDDDGLHLTSGTGGQVVAADQIVVCAGQVSQRELYRQLRGTGPRLFLIGGARKAAELDAVRAIEQGFRLAAR